jgi:hypothetical protein
MGKIVNHHPSVTVVKSKESDEFMFTRYDSTYPVLPYRLAANTMGGNPTPKDSSPFNTWSREICEEFNNEPPHGEELRDKTTPFAPLKEILKIREAILASARPAADFYLTTKGITLTDYLSGVGNGLSEAEVIDLLSDKKRDELKRTGLITRPYGAIFSVFHAEIPDEEVQRAKHYLKIGERLVTEGGLRILTRSQLINGIEGEVQRNKAYLTAHCTPFIMQDFIGLSEPLMHAPGDNAVKLETPVRESYDKYRTDPSLTYQARFE